MAASLASDQQRRSGHHGDPLQSPPGFTPASGALLATGVRHRPDDHAAAPAPPSTAGAAGPQPGAGAAAAFLRRAWCGPPARHPPESPLAADPSGVLAACRHNQGRTRQPWAHPTAMGAPHSPRHKPGPGSLTQPTASAWLTSKCSTSNRSSAALRRARSKSPWASGSMRSAMRSRSSSRRSLSTASNSSSMR